MLEVRGHARGGQGMVTAFEILAKIFSHSGEYQVQAFPFFGVERTGAPIQAFFRIAKATIFNRSNVYQPHLVVVFDETLIDLVPVFDGLRNGGVILLNTEKDAEVFKDKASCIYTVPATQIAVSKGLGSKSLPIVNSAMIGAIVKLLNGDIEIAKQVISKNVPAKPVANAEAAQLAYDGIIAIESMENNLTDVLNNSTLSNGSDKKHIQAKVKIDVGDVPFWDKPMSLNKTGSWRVITPRYVTKTPPCTSNCPAGTDVRLFVKQTADEKFADAFHTIYKHNPFPSTCGRVCPHFCQQNCNRIALDSNLNIGAIERFLGDYGVQTHIQAQKIKYKEKIAVIGAGPAGLTAALRIRQHGYETTVFESLPKAGGMMRIGIPQFRLPENVLDNEIALIEKQGVKIILNKKVHIKELENKYDAVVVATGLHSSSKMNIPNEQLAKEGLKFLYDFKMNKNYQEIKKGDKVAIIGGGNTAIDVARTSKRMGAEPTLYYRRTKNEMPAIAHEVEEAKAEGIHFEFLTAPVAIEPLDKNTLRLTMIKMELGEPDQSGRRRPVPVKGSETTITVNHVITAIGQWNDEFAFAGNNVKAQQGKVDIPTPTPVFCSGDMAWGGTVTEAIGSGNEVAKEVVAFLQNQPYHQENDESIVVLPKDINYNYYLPTARQDNPVKEIKELYQDFSEAVEGLTAEQTAKEASRCLHCGDCYSCGNCFNYCPDAAIHIDEDNRLRIDYDYCKGCGICIKECPCSAIQFDKEAVENI